ncbi:hypothetical protein [Streptosporangium sp. NPDC006007]|uniref:hypothetical protein n=1 Tax=Streptosporangium sp. NPDC006007 TaxID=3154575 RepID=UPI0033A26289
MNPYSKDPEKIPAEARFNASAAHAEFLGVRHHPDRAPTSELRACGVELFSVDLVFATPEESAAFASAAQVLAAQHRIAWERDGRRPASPSADLVTPQ